MYETETHRDRGSRRLGKMTASFLRRLLLLLLLLLLLRDLGVGNGAVNRCCRLSYGGQSTGLCLFEPNCLSETRSAPKSQQSGGQEKRQNASGKNMRKQYMSRLRGTKTTSK